MRTVWRRELDSSSRLHTVRITGILNICCHITTMDDNSFQYQQHRQGSK